MIQSIYDMQGVESFMICKTPISNKYSFFNFESTLSINSVLPLKISVKNWLVHFYFEIFFQLELMWYTHPKNEEKYLNIKMLNVTHMCKHTFTRKRREERFQ